MKFNVVSKQLTIICAVALLSTCITISIAYADNMRLPPPPDGDQNQVMIQPPQGKQMPFPEKHGGPDELPFFASPVIKDPAQLQALLDGIGVNKQSSEKIVALTKNFFKSLDSKIIKIQRYELDIKEEMLKDKPDLQSIQNFITKKTQLFGEIEFSQIKRDLEIRSLLSDDEFEKWKYAIIEKAQRGLNSRMQKLKENSSEPRK